MAQSGAELKPEEQWLRRSPSPHRVLSRTTRRGEGGQAGRQEGVARGKKKVLVDLGDFLVADQKAQWNAAGWNNIAGVGGPS